mmetsp:Transcript_8670/g.9185  ORF Transcript_8670/g.9185 Transcript_8670/m.9185 type:complete len:82 (-) Transcript_8670:194-439(-)
MLESLFGRKRESLNLKQLNNKCEGSNEQNKIVWENQGNKFEDIDQCLRRQSSNSPKSPTTIRRMNTPSSPPNFDCTDPSME